MFRIMVFKIKCDDTNEANLFGIPKNQVETLQRDLHLARMQLCKQKTTHCKCGVSSSNFGAIHSGNVRHLSEEDYLTMRSGDAASGSSTAASETSSTWEAVDEREPKPTLWVPDHAAAECMGCVLNKFLSTDHTSLCFLIFQQKSESRNLTYYDLQLCCYFTIL